MLRRATSLAPNSPESHYNLGITLRDLGDTEGAIRELEMALSLSPTSPRVPNQLAELLTREGRIDEAASEMHRAADHSSTEVRAILAEILKRASQDR